MGSAIVVEQGLDVYFYEISNSYYALLQKIKKGPGNGGLCT